MCGIAGIFHPATPKPVDPARVRTMCDPLAHRGPDGEGVWTAPGIGLGHRRLSIIDLAGGAQPMTQGALTITFNGEIYNFRELRRELEAAGDRFETLSDTEVILAAWARWGERALDRLQGMFAFALWDTRTQTLTLARDRLGVKPLHYAELSDGSIIFGSELKGLLAHPLLRREPDLRAIEDYLALGYVPDSACIVAGVRKLAAGHFLHLERGKPLPAPTRWWDVDFTTRARGSAADLEAELLERLRAAVSSRMIADVPLGAFLSGGVDSSAVIALMAEVSSAAVKTCSIGFDSAEHDETAHARLVARRFATDHRERIVAADDFALIDTLVAAFDEPFADASALPTWRVCELARESVKVALSGDGADEAFAGYRRHRFHAAEARVRGLLPSALRRGLFGPLGWVWPKADWAPRPLRAKSTLLALATDNDHAYALAVGVTPPSLRDRLLSGQAKRHLDGYRGEETMAVAMRSAPARDALDRAQYGDLKVWLPGDILTKVDRASMGVSLEAREPLLDHRLVEFAATLPPSLRIRAGQGKWLMKKAMERYLPPEILYRPKQGFVTPISEWFRGPLIFEAERIARGAGLADTGWFEPAAIARLVEDHRRGLGDHGRTLWQLMMLDKALSRVFGLGQG